MMSSDSDLVKQYRESGDLRILGELYSRYMHLVYGLSLKYLDREDAQDAVTSIFEKIGSKLLDSEITYFKSWLYQVSKNHCLEILRKRSGKKEIISSEIVEMQAELHHNDEIDLEGDLQLLEKCIEQLKKDQQTSVRLFYLENKSYQEVSDNTGFDLKKVKSQIQNGKRNLRICMEGSHEK